LISPLFAADRPAHFSNRLSRYRLTPQRTQNRIRRSIRRIYATLFGGVRSQELTPVQNGIRDGVVTSPACESSTHRL
jgi:hypothetical protein